LTAFTGLLMACFRQSKSRTTLFLTQWLGQPCSPGLTVKLQNLTTKALQSVYQELCAALPGRTVLNIDETATKEGTAKSWLWTFVAKKFTVFAVRPTRGAIVLDELLTGKFKGIVGCDRAKMYWQEERLQWCWAHLKRDFQAMADSRHRKARKVGEQLLAQTKLLFRQWHRFLDREITRTGLKQTLSRVRREVERLLHQGFDCGHGPTEGTCTELLHHRDWLWTFLKHAGVQPTNNASERALRHGVIWRKLSFGTQSASGSRFVETMLTVIETCRQQGRNVFEFVTEAVTQLFRRKRPKSLLSTA
jgi:transposase